MTKLLLTLAPLLLAAAARAQSLDSLAFGARAFEAVAGAAAAPQAPADAFAGVAECGVLDIKTLRPFALDEAADLARPCVEAAAAKLNAKAGVQAGFLSAPQSGKPGKAGLLVRLDVAGGSPAHQALEAALAKREGRLLGHVAKLLVRGDAAPASVSSLQKALDNCVQLTAAVVRDIRSGEDFVKVYGKCLTKNADLKISEVRPAEGLAVTLKTSAALPQVEAYNGFVTVNAGKGPVKVMVVAYAAQIALP